MIGKCRDRECVRLGICAAKGRTGDVLTSLRRSNLTDPHRKKENQEIADEIIAEIKQEAVENGCPNTNDLA